VAEAGAGAWRNVRCADKSLEKKRFLFGAWICSGRYK